MSSAESSSKMIVADAINPNDHISKLPKDLLLRIISKITTIETVRTSVLSKRWENVWKETSQLTLDMRWIPRTLSNVPHGAAKSVAKVVKDHYGNLERFTLLHYPNQYEQETFQTWIQSLIHEKLTKHVMLINCRMNQATKPNFTLNLPPNTFSHPNLISLLLCGYDLENPQAFNNCWNLKTLKLIGVSVEIGVLNIVLVSCSYLEALVLDFSIQKRNGILKIENSGLKFLHISCSTKIDGVEVSTPSVDIFSVGLLRCDMDKVFIANAEIKFNRNYWTIGRFSPHISYNITCTNQEEKSIGHEFMMTRPSDYMKRFGSMSVSVDLTNAKEIKMLKDVLVAWPGEMGELEIVFKHNSTPQEEGESWTKFWEGTKPFPNANFRAYTIWLFNVTGSKEEFALASRLITQGTVVRSLMIKMAPFTPSMRSETNAALAWLRNLPEGHEELIIKIS